MSAVDEVRARLAGNQRLRRLFDVVYAQLTAPDTTVAVSGSLARGDVDAFSDLDFLVVTPDPAAAAAHRRAVHDALRDRYRVLAAFDAAHLGLACLDSVFVVADGGAAKMDLMFWAATDGPPPSAGLVLHDGAGLAATVPPAPGAGEPGSDQGGDQGSDQGGDQGGDQGSDQGGDQGGDPGGELGRAPRDIVGWTCHTRNLIGRGELFEAAYCLDSMRRRMVVPVLLRRYGLPQVNYRRIEARLPAAALARLRATYPGALDPAELGRSLRALTGLFLDEYGLLPAAARTVEPDAVAAAVTLILTEPVPAPCGPAGQPGG